MYGVNSTTNEHYHDVTGLQQKGSHSNYQLMTPIFQISDMAKNAPALMYNMHSERRRAEAIDYSLDCVHMLEADSNYHRGTFTGLNDEAYHYVSSNCTSSTEVIFLVQDPPKSRPAGLTLFPILAYNDRGNSIGTLPPTAAPSMKPVPSEVIGFISAVHNWDTVLSLSTNDQVTGIMAVLSNGVESHSFIYDNGVVIYRGDRDIHDGKYNSQRFEFDVAIAGNTSPLLTSTPVIYTISLYPTDEWIALFEDSTPGITCGVAVGLVVFTSLVFFVYDYLINRNVNEKELILQTKRQFVRYISHEIRTPLNVVLLGFQLLCTEMTNFPHRLQQGQQGYIEQFSDWLELIQDISQSADTAISVLNDLMSYDKLDTGMMVIEREVLAIWDLIRTTIHPFSVQAKAKGIELELIFNDDMSVSYVPMSSSQSSSVRSYKPRSHRIVPVVAVDEKSNPTSKRQAAQPVNSGPTSKRLAPEQVSEIPLFDLEEGKKIPGAARSESLDENHECLVVVANQVVLGDKAKLSQVIRNLISNALKFTPAGGKVTVCTYWKPRGLGDAFEHLVTDVQNSKEKGGDKLIDVHDYMGCGSLVLSVTDTGAGMSEENLSRLFQEGVQFNAGKLQAGQGSGLGLWISKGIVELHRGKLSATSEGEGKGSTFTLELPVLSTRWGNLGSSSLEDPTYDLSQVGSGETQQMLIPDYKQPLIAEPENAQHDSPTISTIQVQDYQEDSMSVQSPSTLSVSSNVGGANIFPAVVPPRKRSNGKVGGHTRRASVVLRCFSRVLVVDDSEIIRKMVCRSLKPIGFQCQQAEDGQQCVDIMENMRRNKENDPSFLGIDLILMDYEMPRLTGPLAVAKLRELGITTPVIGVTGNVLKEDSEYYLQCGANKVIHKPFTIKTLERVLQELVLAQTSDQFDKAKK